MAIRHALGNVASMILLRKIWPTTPEGALYGMALLFSFAGNFVLLGSFLIVAERATMDALGVTVDQSRRDAQDAAAQDHQFDRLELQH